jgi:hypothetical protein
MGHAVGLGVIWPHMCPGEDGRDPVLLAIRTGRRISQPLRPVAVFVEGDDQQAVIRLRPLVVAVNLLLQPRTAYLDTAVVHVMVQVGNDKRDGWQFAIVGREVGEPQVWRRFDRGPFWEDCQN